MAEPKASKRSRRASGKKSTSTNPPPSNKSDDCFTIMPFGGWFDDYYETIYKPAIMAAGLNPRRADDLYRPSTIVMDIWGLTQSCKLALADLTGKNPNVFYELGLAHAIAKPVVLVAESIDDVPFDLRGLRIIVYDKNKPSWGAALQEKITKAIVETLADPAMSVPAAFIKSLPSGEQKLMPEHQKMLLELRQEVDLLRRDVQSNRSVLSPSMNQWVLNELNKDAMIRLRRLTGDPDTGKDTPVYGNRKQNPSAQAPNATVDSNGRIISLRLPLKD